jgi:hypothetical protein
MAYVNEREFRAAEGSSVRVSSASSARGSVGLTLLLVVLVLSATFLTERNALASLRRLSLERLCQKSDRIACGEVVKMRCYRGPYLKNGEILFTDVTIRITDRIAGKFTSDSVTIQVPGGRLGDEFMHCSNSPRYEMGEKVLVFLRPYNGRVWNTGWSHGKYQLRETRAGKSTVVSVSGRKECPISKDEKLSEVRRRITANGGAGR